MRLRAALAQDIRFQVRHGFYYAYAVLTAIYILLLRVLPDPFVFPTLTLILFTDICALGFFFIGAIVLLEKGQNLTDSLFVTPLRLHEYLVSKLLSFLLLSLASASLIAIGGGVRGHDSLLFILGLILSAGLYTLFGLIFAARARHVNDYFVRALGLGLLISLPVLSYIGLFDTALFYAFPTRATLILLDVLGKDYLLGEKLYAVGNLILWGLVMGYFAYHRFEKYVRHPA